MNYFSFNGWWSYRHEIMIPWPRSDIFHIFRLGLHHFLLAWICSEFRALPHLIVDELLPLAATTFAFWLSRIISDRRSILWMSRFPWWDLFFGTSSNFLLLVGYYILIQIDLQFIYRLDTTHRSFKVSLIHFFSELGHVLVIHVITFEDLHLNFRILLRLLLGRQPPGSL